MSNYPQNRQQKSPFFKREWFSAILFLSPTMSIFLVFIIFPVFFSFYLSFHRWNMFSSQRAFIGLANYAQLLHSEEFWRVLTNTLIYTLVTVPLSMAVALAVALMLNRKIIGKKLLRTAYFTPVIVSSVAAAVIWRWVFDPSFGLLNHILGLIGLPSINWLNDSRAAMAAIIIMGVWKSLGFNMVLYLAGLQGIPDHYYEAAEMDGAKSWTKFWYITLPLLAPTTFFIMIMSVISSFQVFDVVFVLTQGGPLGATKVLVYYLYENAFKFFNMGFASATAYVLFAIVFALTLLQVRYMKSKFHYTM
ncbi:MAG: sugar ABC transporter permease [Calditrichaeota bacterium]|nr:MAG: sugar ABC transporter permease [Calditrichota bacterium]